MIFGHMSVWYGFYTPYFLCHASAWRKKIRWWLDLNQGLPDPLSAALPSVLSHHLEKEEGDPRGCGMFIM